MRVALFSAKSYDREFFESAKAHFSHELVYFETKLDAATVNLAKGCDAVCVFVNDRLDVTTLSKLAEYRVRAIALRCAGFNNVDLIASQKMGLQVVRVPAYSPHSVAEHTMALILALNRKTHRAYSRVRESNFALEGLMGFDLHGLTAGLVGTGKIGKCMISILKGFGCKVLAFDLCPCESAKALGVEYVGLDDLLKQSDIVSLHCPLTPESHYLIDAVAIEKMKKDVMLINTSRGGLIDTRAVILALKSKKIGSLGMDVYEEEGDLFFQDLSSQVLQDDVFARLLTFHNVLITAHQAFFTSNALSSISMTTLQNLSEIEQGLVCKNTIGIELLS